MYVILKKLSATVLLVYKKKKTMWKKKQKNSSYFSNPYKWQLIFSLSPTLYPSLVLSSFLFFNPLHVILWEAPATACVSTRLKTMLTVQLASPKSPTTPNLSFSRFGSSIIKLVLIWLVSLVLDLLLLWERQGLHPDLRGTVRAHLCVNGRWNGDVGAEGAAAQRQNCPAAPLVSSGSVWSDWLSQTGW